MEGKSPGRPGYTECKRVAQGDTEGMDPERAREVTVYLDTERMAESNKQFAAYLNSPMGTTVSTAVERFARAYAEEARRERERYLVIADEAWPLLNNAIKRGRVRDVDGERTITREEVLEYMAPDLVESLIDPDTGQLRRYLRMTRDQKADALRCAFDHCCEEDVKKAIKQLFDDVTPKKSRLSVETHYDIITKEFRSLSRPENQERLFSEQGLPIGIESEAEKKKGIKRTTNIKLSFMDGAGGSAEITPMDAGIHSGLCTLWLNGGTELTFQQIYRASTGLPETSEVKDEQLEIVDESLKKMLTTLVEADASEYAKQRGWKDEDGTPITQVILTGQMVKGTIKKVTDANGKKSWGIVLEGKEPLVLYKHAETLKQIASYPQGLLDVKGMKSTAATMALRKYLLYRISRMREDPNTRTRRIDYKKAYENYDLPDPSGRSKQQESRIRRQVEKCLNDWTAKKFVAGWTEYLDDRGRPKGVEIDLSAESLKRLEEKRKQNQRRRSRRSSRKSARN